MKTILVIGATSPTAQVFIKLIESEYSSVNLKLFVRNPERLTTEQLTKYEVIVGDAASYDDYVRSLFNVDYIYNSVGGLETGRYTQLLIKAINDAGVNIKRVVDISAGGIYGEYLSGGAPYLSAVRIIHPKYTKEQINKLSWYQRSELNFTIFRPGLIKNGPETQIVTHTTNYRKIGRDEFNINRATFARAAANALFNDDYHNQSVSVSNGAPPK